MSKNGFFHERPDDYDIRVSPEMQKIVGAKSINWHIKTTHYTRDFEIYAIVEWEGKTYKAASMGQWEKEWYIVEEVKPVIS